MCESVCIYTVMERAMTFQPFLPALEVYAETRFEVSNERSPLSYQWEGHGLRLQLPEGTTARFHIKAVWSSKLELPVGTELVSPVYWVLCEGIVGGQVGVELQHCARVKEEGQHSGLSFAVCNVEKVEPPYQFKLCKGQFSSRSSYGKKELGLSSKFVAIVRRVGENPEQPTAEPIFQAKLYYEKQQLSSATVHIVIVPQLEITTKVGMFSIIMIMGYNIILFII